MMASLTSIDSGPSDLTHRSYRMAKEESKRSLRAPPAQIPPEILNDARLNAAIQAYLPANYNFEIHKTIHHVNHYGSSCVALQMPEGLTIWATAISDIIERYVNHDVGNREYVKLTPFLLHVNQQIYKSTNCDHG